MDRWKNPRRAAQLKALKPIVKKLADGWESWEEEKDHRVQESKAGAFQRDMEEQGYGSEEENLKLTVIGRSRKPVEPFENWSRVFGCWSSGNRIMEQLKFMDLSVRQPRERTITVINVRKNECMDESGSTAGCEQLLKTDWWDVYEDEKNEGRRLKRKNIEDDN